ncbi:unnamed protein product [Sphagnum compactum]
MRSLASRIADLAVYSWSWASPLEALSSLRGPGRGESGSEEPGGGIGGGELENVVILPVQARFSKVATAPEGCS